jgi:hypothetical protein
VFNPAAPFWPRPCCRRSGCMTLSWTAIACRKKVRRYGLALQPPRPREHVERFAGHSCPFCGPPKGEDGADLILRWCPRHASPKGGGTSPTASAQYCWFAITCIESDYYPPLLERRPNSRSSSAGHRTSRQRSLPAGKKLPFRGGRSVGPAAAHPKDGMLSLTQLSLRLGALVAKPHIIGGPSALQIDGPRQLALQVATLDVDPQN